MSPRSTAVHQYPLHLLQHHRRYLLCRERLRLALVLHLRHTRIGATVTIKFSVVGTAASRSALRSGRAAVGSPRRSIPSCPQSTPGHHSRARPPVTYLDHRLVVLPLVHLERPQLHVGLYYRVVELAADQPLRVENRVDWVHRGLVLGCIADQALTLGEGDIRRRGTVTLVVRYDLNAIILPYACTE